MAVFARGVSGMAPPLARALLLWCVASTTHARKGCQCSDLRLEEATESRVVIPRTFASRRLSAQLVLLKVPETGSSTATRLLEELGEALERPVWSSVDRAEFDAVVKDSGRDAPKWALGHRGWGGWLHAYFHGPSVDLVTTARLPADRLASSAEKRLLRAEPPDCARAAGVALKFWGIDARRGLDAARAASKFDTVILMERYNESLVAFALRHRLQLADVLPPLSKYHAGAEHGEKRAQARRACAAAVDLEASPELKIERAIYDGAAADLDATFAELRSAGVDVEALLKAFTGHLHAAMTTGADHKTKAMGRVDASAGLDTLIMNVCVRDCAVAALRRSVVLDYPGPEAPRPFAALALVNRSDGNLKTGRPD